MENQPTNKIVHVMGFDFGTRRMGVAVGQRLTQNTQALAPFKAKDGIPNWDELQRLVDEWQPDAFVVGLPLNMDGSASEMSRRANKFANRLCNRFRRPSFTQDERLTSYEAKGIVMAESGERDFGAHSVDGLAAQLILQSWMEAWPLNTKDSE